MSVPQTSDGFWRSFDRDHEALWQEDPPDGLKTTQWTRAHVAHFTCAVCKMPCHLVCRKIEIPLMHTVPGLAHGRDVQHTWVAKHGPAPHRSNHRNAALAGQTPIIVLPDAVGMAEKGTKRHLLLPEKSSQDWSQGQCGQRHLYRSSLASCWFVDPCANCIELLR